MSHLSHLDRTDWGVSRNYLRSYMIIVSGSETISISSTGTQLVDAWLWMWTKKRISHDLQHVDPDMYMHHVDIFPYCSLYFSYLIFPKKTLSSPISLTIAWQTFPITTASCMTSPPYILLFTPHSPVICKDNFPLVYMYKSSRYYAVFHHRFGFYFPWSPTL